MPERWAAAGFAVAADGTCAVGTVRLRLGAPGWSWSVRGLRDGALDGLATRGSDAPPRAAAPTHPNGAIALDHVVVATPDLDRTLTVLQEAGLDLRRVREAGRGARQGFFRVGEALLEVVGPVVADGTGPATFWGLTLTVADLDATAATLRAALGPSRDAVQEGRRIATVRRDAGLGVPVALMSPEPVRT